MTVKKRERKQKMAQVEALLAQGYTLQQAARAVGVNPATLCRSRQKLPPQKQKRLTPRPPFSLALDLLLSLLLHKVMVIRPRPR